MPLLPNAKHELFAQKIAKGMSAKDAYRDVYPKSNENTCGVEGYKHLNKPSIKERVVELQAKSAEKAELSAAWVLEKLKLMADVNSTPLYDDNGNVRFTDAAQANRSLELLGKYFKLFTDRVESTTTFNFDNVPTEDVIKTLEVLEKAKQAATDGK